MSSSSTTFVVILFCIFISLVYTAGRYNGIQSVYSEIEESNQLLKELENANHQKEIEYTIKVKELENAIKQSKTTYSNSISEYNKLSSDRLLQSENRAKYYKQQAESCSIESRNLAEYTAKLDRQLTEGIDLVRELTELIKFRDEQLKQVGVQLKIDRELINGFDREH